MMTKCRIGGREVELNIEDRILAGSVSGARRAKGEKVGEPHTRDAATRNQSTEGQGNVKSGGRTPQPTNLGIEQKVKGGVGGGALSATRPARAGNSQELVANPAPSPLMLLLGQLPSGKNAQGISKRGHRYAKPRFKAWREDAMVQLKALGCIPCKTIDYPVHFKAWYWAGDRIVRDAAGMQDALGHLLEYSKILKNDGLIKDVTWRYQGLNRKSPKVEFTLSPME